jgi:hypothetical protein
MDRFYLRTSDVARLAGCSEFLVRDAARRGIVPANRDSKGCALFNADAPVLLRRHQANRRAAGAGRDKA